MPGGERKGSEGGRGRGEGRGVVGGEGREIRGGGEGAGKRAVKGRDWVEVLEGRAGQGSRVGSRYTGGKGRERGVRERRERAG